MGKHSKPKAAASAAPAPAPSILDKRNALAKLIEKAKAAEEQYKAAIEGAKEPFVTKYNDLKAQRDDIQSKMDEVIKEASEAGLPRGIFGPVSTAQAKRTSSSKPAGERSKQVAIADLASIVDQTVRVEAWHRTKPVGDDGVVPTVEVDYTVLSAESTDDKGNPVTTFILRGQRVGSDTVREGNLTQAASAAGWHQASDVAFALATRAGVLDKYPELKPSYPEVIVVDGVSLA